MALKTLHVINQRPIAEMKPGCNLIAVGRGSRVDRYAVAAGLDSKHVPGYAADVFGMGNWTLKDRPRTIDPAFWPKKEKGFYPHLGSAVNAIRREIALEVARNIIRVFDGHRPPGMSIGSINS